MTSRRVNGAGWKIIYRLEARLKGKDMSLLGTTFDLHAKSYLDMGNERLITTYHPIYVNPQAQRCVI